MLNEASQKLEADTEAEASVLRPRRDQGQNFLVKAEAKAIF